MEFLNWYVGSLDKKMQIEGIVKQLAAVRDHGKIMAVINLLTTEFTYSSQANQRKVFQQLDLWIIIDRKCYPTQTVLQENGWDRINMIP